jgi:hypothetical protein
MRIRLRIRIRIRNPDRSLREEERKNHLDGRSGAVSTFHADLVPVSKLSQKNCRTEPRRLLRSSRPQEICQPPREGFFSVHGLSGCVHSQLQLLRNIFRLFSLYRGSSWSSIQQQWQLSERDHKMKYCAVLNCSNSSKVANVTFHKFPSGNKHSMIGQY